MFIQTGPLQYASWFYKYNGLCIEIELNPYSVSKCYFIAFIVALYREEEYSSIPKAKGRRLG